MSQQKLKRLLQKDMSRKEFLSLAAVFLAGIFGITGLVKELSSRAGTPTASIEPETGSKTTGVQVVSDGTASAGQAIKFADPTGLPVGNIAPHWTQVVAEDFNRPVISGNFLSTYTSFTAFDGFTDTSKHGTYRAAAPTVTVHDSMLDVFVHYDATTGTRNVACILPHGYTGQLYGKVTWKMHMDNVQQYKIVPLWWSARDVWADGELDFPENGIGSPTSPIAINLHEVTGNPAVSHGTTVAGVFTGPSHVYDFEWTPGVMNFKVDGVLVRTTTSSLVIPVNPMRFQIQIEVADTSGATIPDTANQGHVYVDWVSQYTYS